MTQFFNRTDEKQLRSRLRHEMPRAEVVLWSRLRNRQIDGVKFRRQVSIGPYVTDFYAPQLKLAIEADGDSHFGDAEEKRDMDRQRYIEAFGVRVVRYNNVDVLQATDHVIDAIRAEIGKRSVELNSTVMRRGATDARTLCIGKEAAED